MSREEARKHFERVQAKVQTLPPWQQSLLRESLESTLPEPRAPVNRSGENSLSRESGGPGRKSS